MKKFICQTCEYVHKGPSAPDECPQCKSPKSQFKVKRERIIRDLLNKLKNKEPVSKEEYEAGIQEDIREKNFIVEDGLSLFKEFPKQEQFGLELDRGQQRQGFNNYGNQRPSGNQRQQYNNIQPGQQSQPREQQKPKYPETSLADLMAIIKGRQ